MTIEERESSGEEEEVMDEDDDESGIKPEPPSDDDEIMDGSGIETPVTGFETPTNLEGQYKPTAVCFLLVGRQFLFLVTMRPRQTPKDIPIFRLTFQRSLLSFFWRFFEL